MNVIYRVVIRISYHEAFFDFQSAEEACIFATTAIMHSATSKDQKKMAKVSIIIINADVKEEED